MTLNLPCPSGITCIFDYQDCTATSWASQIGAVQFEVHSPILHQDYVAFVGSDSSYAKITYGGVSGGNATNSDYCIRYVAFKNISNVYTNWRTIIGNETGNTYCSTIAMNGSGKIQFTRRDITTNYYCSSWHVVCWTSDKINHRNTLWIDAVKIGTSSGCDGWGSDTYLAKGPSWGYSDNDTAFGCYIVGDTIPSDADIISNMKYLMGQYTSDWKLNLNPDNLDIYHKPRLDVHTCLESPYPKLMWFVSENPNDVKTAATKDYHIPCFDIPFPSPVWYTDGTDVTHGGARDYIEMGAFKGATNLTSVVIPRSVKKIGPEAFADTGLTEVTIANDCVYEDTSFPPGCVINFYDPISPVTKFEIDTSRYSATDGYVYDKRGNKIAETGVTSDTNTNAVNSYGIRFNNNTYCITDPDAVYLPTDYPWTITCRLKDIWEGRYNGGSNVFGLYNGSTKVFNVFMNTNNLTYLINGGNVATPTNGYCYWSGNDSLGYIEQTIIAGNEMCAWHHEIKMICDTEKIYVFLNGLKELEFPVSAFGDKIDKILWGHNALPTPFTITYFAINNIAEPIDRIVYKWDITRKGADNYFSVAKLYLYTEEEGGTYSGDVGARTQNYVFAAGPPSRPDERAFPTELVGIGTYRQGSFRLVYGNGVYNVSPNGALTVYMTCPLCNEYGKPDASINTVKALAYQYLTPNEPFNQRHPVDWTLQASLDGGITWQTLDTQTNQGYPGQNALSPVYTVQWPQ